MVKISSLLLIGGVGVGAYYVIKQRQQQQQVISQGGGSTGTDFIILPSEQSQAQPTSLFGDLGNLLTSQPSPALQFTERQIGDFFKQDETKKDAAIQTQTQSSQQNLLSTLFNPPLSLFSGLRAFAGSSTVKDTVTKITPSAEQLSSAGGLSGSITGRVISQRQAGSQQLSKKAEQTMSISQSKAQEDLYSRFGLNRSFGILGIGGGGR